MLLDGFVNINCIQRRDIKAREPHIDHDGNLEIGFDALKLPVEFLAVVLRAEHGKQLRRVILAACHDHSDFLDGLEFFLFLLGKSNAVVTLLCNSPLRSKLDDDFIEVVSDIAIGADKHGLASDRCALGYAAFIVLYKIFCYGTQAVRVT